MKLALSYFYQIRFFKPYMIPVSTAKSDPAWYHDGAGAAHMFVDKRGVLNGARTQLLNTGTLEELGVDPSCPCLEKDPHSCSFVQSYEEALSYAVTSNWQYIYPELEKFATEWCTINNIQEEPIIVFIVYEAPNNPCSERWSWLKIFEEQGIECKELQYPIKENYK